MFKQFFGILSKVSKKIFEKNLTKFWEHAAKNGSMGAENFDLILRKILKNLGKNFENILKSFRPICGNFK